MTKPKKKNPQTLRNLLVLLALTVVLLAFVLIRSLPYMKVLPWDEDPDHLARPTEPMEAPTEPPVPVYIPEPEANPYGRNDFQFEGRYLKNLRCDSIPGVDVSAYQGDINWNQVAVSGIKFAMIRVGYRGYGTGKIVEDAYARENLRDALHAGLEVGVYFFSQALNEEEVQEEIDFILDIIKDYEITMPVVFDWERIRGEQSRSNEMDARTLTDCAKTFLETIELAGYDAMVYFNPHQSRNLFYLAELKDYDFWLASYTDRMDFPYKVDMWQYTEKGRIPGIETDCDFNVYFPSYG